ncbi:MAG: response regulator [Gammaproteobacteria bacterium]|nr:response regulator [Gammaproteobacteria bacterium]MBU1653364.1 response regulator [Gammaproteobacteria bacterium]MBU1962791.1 response regulator [Gammaproteobacteria bacterium]
MDEKWRLRFERERRSRKEAEELLEQKAVELYRANRQLLENLLSLEKRIEERTQELTAAMQAARRADQAKTEFLAGVSHEFRTPITGIDGMVDLLLGSDLNEEQRSQALAIRRSARALGEMVNNILEYSQSDGAGLELRELPFDLPDLIEAVAAHIQEEARKKGLTLEVELPLPLRRTFVGDVKRLRQVLSHLANNAVKFTEKGKIGLRVSADTDQRTRSMVHFEVIDSGIGIREEDIPGLFEAFSQVDASFARRFAGAGLGLALSRRIIESMDGKLGVESRFGEGSTFWFAVPLGIEENTAGYWILVDEEMSVNDIGTGTPPPKEVRRKSLKVLVVDDNLINRQFAMHFLNELGHRSGFAENGREAVEQVSREGYDLVLMDIQMPVLDGYQATRQIRELGGTAATLPIYAMSADDDAATTQAAQAAGMNGFIGKPVDRRSLEKLLQAIPARG